ncbi:hypothetical protein [Streptomyces sp. NPDC051546]|uniref:hypothetical protein n=1 Tax=Streptomyces sp. NPDC051546 TaxID=3365655 RepID=UPI0037A6AE02
MTDVEEAAESAESAESVEPVDRVHWLQRSMAGLATLLMAAMTAWGVTSPFGMVLILPFLAIAPTPFVRERGTFRTLCLALGASGLLLGTVLVSFGFIAVIPSAVVLLLAATADPRRRRVPARVCAGAAVLVTAGALAFVGSLAYEVWLRPSYAYSVEIPGPRYGEDGLARGDLWRYGVTGIHEERVGSATRLEVTYDGSLTGPERAALREALTAIPGAGPLQDCGRGDCD